MADLERAFEGKAMATKAEVADVVVAAIEPFQSHGWPSLLADPAEIDRLLRRVGQSSPGGR